MQSFFERVYRLVRQVPPGKVTSYGAIARMLGQPHAARTVGWALHGLPEGSDVPWHRVVNSRGRISISGRGHGADLQRALLKAEGIEFDERGTVDWERFGWAGLPWPEVEELLAGPESPVGRGPAVGKSHSHPELVEGHPELVEGHPELVEGHPELVEGHPELVEG